MPDGASDALALWGIRLVVAGIAHSEGYLVALAPPVVPGAPIEVVAPVRLPINLNEIVVRDGGEIKLCIRADLILRRSDDPGGRVACRVVDIALAYESDSAAGIVGAGVADGELPSDICHNPECREGRGLHRPWCPSYPGGT
jgi:hypothetical protein